MSRTPRRAPTDSVHAVVFQEGGWWIGQCLEVDLATQTRRLEDLPGELERLLAVQLAASAEAGIPPFAGLAPAPRRFWDLYERAKSRLAPVETEAPQDLVPLVEARVAA
jgi:hypothetical protein